MKGEKIVREQRMDVGLGTDSVFDHDPTIV
jgi:hypothetical protein